MNRPSATQTHQQKPTATPATSGVLQRKCACGNHTIAGGECEECSKKERFGLQSKPKVSKPGDEYEQEADRIAELVLAAPVSSAFSGASLHTQRFSRQATAQDTAPASVDSVLASPGRPLNLALQQDIGQRFGYDFSRVRVHSDGAAEQSAQDVDAHAYTVGHNIVFGAGRYAPTTSSGRALLAHELAHVVQQDFDRPRLQRKTPTKPATTPLNYDPTEFVLSPPDQPLTLDQAKDMVNDKIKDGELTAASVSGAKAGSDEEIMLWFILAQVGRKDQWGKEVDIQAPIGWAPPGGGAPPVGKVTVRIDDTGKAGAELLATGAVAVPAVFANRQDVEKELKDNYGIADVRKGDKDWELTELNQVAAAFKLLPRSDRAALKGVHLERVVAIDGDEHAGEFAANQSVEETTVVNEAVLRLADGAFPASSKGFVGGAANAAPSSFLTIVHEVGHAVASKALRDATKVQFEASAARNEAVETHNAAVEATASAVGEYNSLVDEYNGLVEEHKKLGGVLAETKKSGDKAAIKAVQAELDAKKKEVDAKRAEVSAKKKELDAAKADEGKKRGAVETATKKETAKKKLKTAATARGMLESAADTRKSEAEAARKKAAGTKLNDDEKSASAAYRSAVDDCATAIAALHKSAQEPEAEMGALDEEAQAAIDARNGEREKLAAAAPDNPALSRYEAADQAQDRWLEAVRTLVQSAEQPKRVRLFVDFVTNKKIEPFTKYARDNWPDKPEEFFAEAYSLWLTDPEYLRANAKALYDWFNKGSYRI